MYFDHIPLFLEIDPSTPSRFTIPIPNFMFFPLPLIPICAAHVLMNLGLPGIAWPVDQSQVLRENSLCLLQNSSSVAPQLGMRACEPPCHFEISKL